MTVALLPDRPGATRAGDGSVWPLLLALGERTLFVGAVALAAGGLDVLVRAHGGFATLRALLWAAVYGGFALLAVLHPVRTAVALLRGWPLLVLPGVAVLSVAWSQAPDQTLRAGIQFAAITVFGLIFGSRCGLGLLIRLVFVGLGLTGLASAVVAVAGGRLALDHLGNLIGAFSHKNVLGNTMTVLLVMAAALAGDRRGALAAWPMALLALVLLAASGSATGLVATLVGTVLLTGWMALRLPLEMRLLAVGLGGLVTVGLAMALAQARADPFLVVVDLLGRDATLTGRSTLWAYAEGLIAERPWIGIGYQAFWTFAPGTESAWLRWIVEQELASFHNGYVEIVVELGVLGAAAVALGFGCYGWMSVRHALRRPGVAASVPLLLLAVAAVTNLAEVAIFIRHGLLQFLLAAFFARMVLDQAAPTFPATGARR